MKQRASRTKRRRRAGRVDQEDQAQETAGRSRQAVNEQLSPFYAAGPLVGLSPRSEEGTPAAQSGRAVLEGEVEVAPLPTLQGRGPREHRQVHNTPGGSLRLEGRTDADFDGGSFHTEDVHTEPATGCSGCSGNPCVHVTGVLAATYSVTTRVTLPSVDDYPNLTACQRRRVQDAIDNVLAPHEQEHVRAFNTYNGATRREFDLTLCRSQFNSAIRSMFEAEEQARRQAAQAASDALDPFHFEVDLNCEDEEVAGAGGPESNPPEEE